VLVVTAAVFSVVLLYNAAFSTQVPQTRSLVLASGQSSKYIRSYDSTYVAAATANITRFKQQLLAGMVPHFATQNNASLPGYGLAEEDWQLFKPFITCPPNRCVYSQHAINVPAFFVAGSAAAIEVSCGLCQAHHSGEHMPRACTSACFSMLLPSRPALVCQLVAFLQAADQVCRGGGWLQVPVQGGQAWAAAQGLHHLLTWQQRK
jgi:hypothetical protein